MYALTYSLVIAEDKALFKTFCSFMLCSI